jgi:rod shape-determining protein MreB
MIIDIGGGTTDVAIISLADISVCESVRIAGDDFDEAIIGHMKKTYNMAIGQTMAETIKIEIGSAAPCPELAEDATIEVRGRDLISGLPRKTEITAVEIREALQEPVTLIVDCVTRTLEVYQSVLAGRGRTAAAA